MKTPRITNAVGHIDDKLITDAAESRKKKNNNWIKWGAAACFAVIAIAGAAILPSVLNKGEALTADRYKDLYIMSSESAIIWQWEYLTDSEKYRQIEIGDISYNSKGRSVSEELVGESLGTYTISGYDEINEEWHSISAEAYRLNNIAEEQFIAVKLEDKHYVFMNGEYAPPATLGELMGDIDLPEVIELSRFSEKRSGPDSSHFRLENDDYIWEVLSDCESAPFVEDQMWHEGGREYISFTISSEAMGVYKNVMYITQDGYLWTNAFSWQYLFYIGEEAAGKIISYAKANSEQAEYEPYMNTLAGTVTEITDDYILIDDSVLCKDPDDGISYKVPLDDLRISRYVDSGVIKVGDTVQVSYTGEIDAADGNCVNSAVDISKAIISEEDILILE